MRVAGMDDLAIELIKQYLPLPSAIGRIVARRQVVDNGRPPPRRVAYGREMRIGGSGWFGRLLAVGLGAIVLVTAAMLSIIVLAVLFGLGLIVVGYLWWKTRELRRQARTFGVDGRIVDVEVVHRDVANDDSTRR
jgi:hypothetical protein